MRRLRQVTRHVIFYELSANQHGHLILWNGCSHSDLVFDTNTHCFFSMKYWRNWWDILALVFFYYLVLWIRCRTKRWCQLFNFYQIILYLWPSLESGGVNLLYNNAIGAGNLYIYWSQQYWFDMVHILMLYRHNKDQDDCWHESLFLGF